MSKRVVVPVLCGIGLAGVGVACFGDVLESVHFNSTRVDFALPPSPIVIRSWEETQTRAASRTAYDYDEAADARREAVNKALAAAQAEAISASTAENLRAAAGAARTKVELGGEGVESARERAEAFEIAAGGRTTLLPAYLQARALLDDSKPAEARGILTAALAEKRDDPLAGHLLYGLAMADYDEGKYAASSILFDTAAGAKTSPRRAPALIMAVRTRLRESEATPAEIARAERLLVLLEGEFPKGRFSWSAVGWRGRAAFLKGERGIALAAYLRQSDTATTTAQGINALASIRTALKGFTAADSTAFRAEVGKDPSLLRPYLEYRIHHTALDTAGRKNLYAFVTDFGGPAKAGLGGDLRAYLSEMALLAGDREAAAREARAALADPGERADLAHTVLGGLALKAGDLKAAEGHYTSTLKGGGLYARAALEPLALIAERTGRPGVALDNYFTLGYDGDVAYLLDVKMTPEQIRAYAAKQTQERKDKTEYALGIRLLRLDRFDEAERIFADLGVRRAALAKVGSRDYAWNTEAPDTIDKLYDPLETTRDLRTLRKAVDGTTGETRSEAIYALASYYYTRRNLLLYNADLWEGGRSFLLGVFWNSSVADADDRAKRTAHAYEHECLARARAACLQIIKETPDSPWAAKALYRAATSERRLADLNPQWRDLSRFRGNFWKQAAGHLEELARRFPNDPLAANARKYAKVFQEEAGDEWRRAAFSSPAGRMAKIRMNEGLASE